MKKPALLICGLALLPNCASTPDPAPIAECYDLKVRAELVQQLPALMPRANEDVLVMSWPWFLEFQDVSVIEGAWEQPQIAALIVQHTFFTRTKQTWYFRRNNSGWFNLLGPSARGRKLCPTGTPPVRAHLVPGEGQTLESLRSRALDRYGWVPLDKKPE